MVIKKRFVQVSLIAAIFFVGSAYPRVTPSGIISNNMVLQRDVNIPIWGTARPFEYVQIEFLGKTYRIKANEKGEWETKLDPAPAGGPFTMKFTGQDVPYERAGIGITDDTMPEISHTCDLINKKEVKNIMVGEVWICSGQSNMAWKLHSTDNAPVEIASANYPEIRCFVKEQLVGTGPGQKCDGRWVVSKPETVGKTYSAIGYFFGKELHKKLKVPVGLINIAWGGTAAHSWVSPATLELPRYQYYSKRFNQWQKDRPKYWEMYRKTLEKWELARLKAEQKGTRLPLKPNTPAQVRESARPAGMYHGMLMPIVPYAIRGVIWYQGESNHSRAYEYRDLFPRMIRDWRQAWKQNFPFLFVQIANFGKRKQQPGESDWAELREAQFMALSESRTAMAVTIDVGTADDIHPRNKKPVGHRLALAAFAKVYGQDIICSGPLYRNMQVEGNKIRIYFDHVGSGLVSYPSDKLVGFAIASKNHKFVWAQAKIEGDTVVVSSSEVKIPIAVRYAWADNPACNLYNKEGLPASPFRTDDWAGLTSPPRNNDDGI